MKEIFSRQNEEIKLVTQLQTQKGRLQQRKFVAEGVRTCQALMESANFTPETIYCTEKMLETANNLTKKFVEVILVSDNVMEKMSSASSPSGLLCTFNIPENPQNSNLTSGIVLAGISDPGNMGTLIRTCAAMGFETAVLINCTDVYSPKVVQSSAGEIGRIKIFNYDWQELIENINSLENKLKLIALVVSDGKRPEEINFKNSLLVIGSEAHGIPKEFINQCDEKLTIPMQGQTESLNASIAGAIAMYLASKNNVQK